ncbi:MULTISPECIES: hypothetical protein [Deinococcus]|uniref:Uncharacterized protein n=1 Tax=Deinococcus rufus TaxID=2136097 RepID=A0ABV7ZEK3_9DEIO|nr:hypothetical protein [Deinococcus sp. AB2017081]WQE96932.1 hypothetical protein U2P90_08520 [Deinococcus sp. AB2017081]
MSSPDSSAPQGIAFTLDGVDDLGFARILNDVMHDAAFGRPLQIQAQEPRTGSAARLTVVFQPEHRQVAVDAMQRLKTILLRHGVQVDSISVPGRDARNRHE